MGRPGKQPVIDLEEQTKQRSIKGPIGDDSAMGEDELNIPWVPVFKNFTGCKITYADSPSIIMNVSYRLARACILSKDIDNTLKNMEDLVGELAVLVSTRLWTYALSCALHFILDHSFSYSQSGMRALMHREKFVL